MLRLGIDARGYDLSRAAGLFDGLSNAGAALAVFYKSWSYMDLRFRQPVRIVVFGRSHRIGWRTLQYLVM